MSALRGSRGKIKFSSTFVCDIVNWNATISVDRPDITALSEVSKQYGTGLISGTGSFTTYEQYDVGGVFFEEYTTGQVIELHTEAGVCISGTALVTDLNITNSVDGLTEFVYNFVFTDQITVNVF
jgi:hypothetical protein